MSAELLLLLVFCVAFVSPLLSRLLHLPVPVGELVLGLLIGYLLGGQEIPPVLDFLGEFGFLLLMFLAGLEIDFDLLERMSRGRFAGYFLYSLGVFITAIAVALLSGFGTATLLILSLASIGLMVATLRDAGVSGGFSQKVMIAGAVGELLSLLFLTLMEKLGRFTDPLKIAGDLSLVLLFFLLFFLFFFLTRLLLWWYPEIIQQLTYEEDPSATGIRLSFALMFTSAVLAHMAGVESVLGAFLAGITLSYFIRKKHDLESKLSSVGYGFLIPVFFIETGMSMKLEGLTTDSLKWVPLFLLLMLLVRYVPSPLLLLGGMSVREAAVAPLLLSYPFTLMIAGIEIARSSELIDSGTALSLFITAVASSLIFPWAGKLALGLVR